MNLINFLDFFSVMILIVSITLSLIWFFNQKNNPYLHWFDKVLVLFFMPLTCLSFFLLLVMSTGEIMSNFI